MLSYYVYLRSEFHVVMSVTIYAYNDVRFVFTPVGGRIDLFMLFFVCLRIMVSNTFCVLLLLCLSSFCCKFLWIDHV